MIFNPSEINPIRQLLAEFPYNEEVFLDEANMTKVILTFISGGFVSENSVEVLTMLHILEDEDLVELTYRDDGLYMRNKYNGIEV